jgi:hypothetical protein
MPPSGAHFIGWRPGQGCWKVVKSGPLDGSEGKPQSCLLAILTGLPASADEDQFSERLAARRFFNSRQASVPPPPRSGAALRTARRRAKR